ncbi:dihydrofolate reductase [Aureispira anguillae]|uniref:Dihydrofolate reductase n=1 Tax=Aureispira anguillae TaxID=2864201 RepID=A0A916DVL2_9BACT|nr:dihydrofolate reductase [Aureispira anguillae]BDS13690.1 dihydrofolate reductase [Aureispira anguillae]
MRVSTIVGMGNHNEIGKGNDIPWYLPADLKYFKKITSGHPIIMGRKCFESIGKPLPNRTNIIVSRNPEFHIDGCILVHSIGAALAVAQDKGAEEAFIIGGGEIYKKGLPLSTRLYLTTIDITVKDADVFFPKINMDHWNVISQEAHQKDAKNPYDYTFKVLERKE